MRELVTAEEPGDGIRVLTLRHPSPHLGTWELVERLAEALEGCVADEVAVVVVGSAAPDAFVTHADLDDILATVGDGTPSGDPASWFRAVEILDEGPLISIAAVTGRAWGGGAELAWACDLRVAGSTTTFAQPEIHLGVTPGLGGLSRLARLVGESRAMQIALDGTPFDARAAASWGLVHEVVADEDVDGMALAWARELAARPHQVLRDCKEVLVGGRDLPLRDALRQENRTFRSAAQRPDGQRLLRAAADAYRNGATPEEALGL